MEFLRFYWTALTDSPVDFLLIVAGCLTIATAYLGLWLCVNGSSTTTASQEEDDPDARILAEPPEPMMSQYRPIVPRANPDEGWGHTTHEAVCLVYTPTSGACYKELTTGTRSFRPDAPEDIRWNFMHLPYGTYRVWLARRVSLPQSSSWEVINTEEELQGKSSGMRSNPVIIGCTIHVKHSRPYPSIDKRYRRQPFEGVEFFLKRSGEIQ